MKYQKQSYKVVDTVKPRLQMTNRETEMGILNSQGINKTYGSLKTSIDL